MDAAGLLRQQLQTANQFLEGTMADVTQEQADWQPPGVAVPVGAAYTHAVFSEDMIVNGVLRQQPPLAATEWAGRMGLSEPHPMPGQNWADYAPWTRRLRVDLDGLRQYAQAVYANVDDYLAGLTPEDLDSQLDLTALGMGQVTLGWAIAVLVVGHVNNMMGEISAIKGVQGARGYPF